MSLQSCYECGKEISSKAIICPQCGALQNPVSDLVDKSKGFFAKWKEEKRKKRKLREEKEYEHQGLQKNLILGLLGWVFFSFIFVFVMVFILEIFQ